jgi:hypothetical protein
VGRSNTSRNVSDVSRTAFSRATTRVASREWPPRTKKSSPVETIASGLRFSTSAKTSATATSAGVEGAWPWPVAEARSGAGSARRSSFPFTVTGNVSSSTNTAGTMYSGNTPAAHSRTASTSAVPVR